MKNFLKILSVIVIIGGLVYLMIYTEASYNDMECGGLKVVLDYPGPDTLIATGEIEQIVIALEDSLSNKAIEDINIEAIENELNQNPYIRNCDALVTVNGCLLIKVKQRRPLIRIINESGVDFIIDDEGFILPYQNLHPVRLLLANGHIEDAFSFERQQVHHLDSLGPGSSLHHLYDIAIALESDLFNKYLIAQLYVDKKEKIELVPALGNQLIKLGDVRDLDYKLKNLKTFYHSVITRKGWEYYKSINIEYQNQVICSN